MTFTPHHLISLLWTTFVVNTYATEIHAEPDAHLKIKACVTESSILIRWAPVDELSWLDGKKYGYVLEKYVVKDTSGWHDYPSKELPAGSVLFPAKPEKWTDYIRQSDYAAVIAQALYGERFSLEGNQSKGIARIINRAEELQQRFLTLVFMAEYDFQAALLAGWGWEDQQISDSCSYLYRVFINKPRRTSADTAVVWIETALRKSFSQPMPPEAVFGNRSVLLIWNYGTLSGEYHSYHVERAAFSVDEAENISETIPEERFFRITELPLTALTSMQEIFFTDSLEDNQTVYIYRIRGIDSFGREGPPSKSVKGVGMPAEICMPEIISGEFIGRNQVNLSWKLTCESPEEVVSFSIEGREELQDIDSPIVAYISPDAREWTFPVTRESDYWVLTAHTIRGEKRISLPFLVRQIDSIPPMIPENLLVQIDTIGIAHLSWSPNHENDLRGYRVFRSFTEGDEMSVLTPQILTKHEYMDTLSLKTINQKVYYAVSSVDFRYNESNLSPVFLALKPDKIPPAEPVFTDYKIGEEGQVTISWITDETDQATYYLLRKESGSMLDPVTVFIGDKKQQSHTDRLPRSGCYEYRVLAIDPANNISSSPTEMNICVQISKTILKVNNFTAYADRKNGYIELAWQRHPEAVAFRIYKSVQGKPGFLWKELSADITKILDEDLYPASTYRYDIILLTKDKRSCKPQSLTLKYE